MKARKVARGFSYFADHGVEQTRGAPLTEHEDNHCDTSRDVRSDSDDGVEVPEHPSVRRKRQRLDPELLSVVSILEKEAKHLRAMLEEAKEERELDRAERRRLWEQMRQDQEDKSRPSGGKRKSSCCMSSRAFATNTGEAVEPVRACGPI